MPINEMQDAAEGLDTSNSFMPDARGSYNPRSDNYIFNGELGAGDEDWVAITLKAGTVYTFTVAGRAVEDDVDTADVDETLAALNDSILKIMDSKGGLIEMKDDEDGAMGMLHPTIKFAPEEDGVYYISVSAYNANPELMNTGGYSVTVSESAPPDPNAGMNIPGTAGNDKIIGTENNDTINGNDGSDSLYGGAGDDTLIGGEDDIPAAVSPAVDDTAPAGEEEDGGNDLLVGGPGADVLMGGDGIDTISYKYSPDGVHINLMSGSARGGDAGGDSFGDPEADPYDNDIENVQGSMHDDNIMGDGGDNRIWGLGGNDELAGGDGADMLDGGMGDDDLAGGDGVDTLTGGYGADTLAGGDDMDTASYMGSMMGVEVRLHSYLARGGDAEGDTFAGRTTYEHMTLDEDDQPMETESSAADIEHLTGSANDDILAGDGRNNTIMGGAGDDKIYGGPGDSADGEMGNRDTLHGGDGNDMIFGGLGNDTLMGDGGDDMLAGGPGMDTYDGGAGNDMIYVDLADIDGATGSAINGGENAADAEMGDSDTVSFERFTDEDGGVNATNNNAVTLGTGIYINVENAIGTDFADTITGSDEENNTIEGGEGGDALNGGEATGDSDTLSYASSDKRVRVDLAANTAVGGHATNDAITANSFENVIGTAHDDVLTGNDEDNMLTGGDGDDELVGGAGDDTLSGGAGEDDLEGSAGDDTLEGGAGADELDGGDDAATGENTLSYASSDAGVAVNLTSASVSGGHAQGDEIAVYDDIDHDGDELTDSDGDNNNLDDTDTDRIDVATFRKVTGSDHNDSITGDYRMNVLNGMGGDDTIRGQAGWDMLIGGSGADRLDGGESGGREADPDADPEVTALAEDVDWAVYRHAEGGVMVDLNTMRGTGGDAMGDVLTNIELVWGSEDEENGDTFIASAGADLIHGDLGSDTVSYETSKMGVTVVLSDQHDDGEFVTRGAAPADTVITTATAALGVGTPDEELADAIAMDDGDGNVPDDPEDNVNGAAGDRLGGIENLTGSNYDDTLTGDGNDNTLMGGNGQDVLIGGDGDDTLHGGAGDDDGGAAGVGLSGGAGDDMLDGGAGDDELDGGADNDTLLGGAGDDVLDGDVGNDKLNGGTGDDELTGGDGDDTFVIGLGGGFDYIVDFDDAGNDEIDLSAFTSIENYMQLQLSMREFGSSVVIDLSDHGGGTITLQGTELTELDADDFVLQDDFMVA